MLQEHTEINITMYLGCQNHDVNSALKKGSLSLGDGFDQPYTQEFLFLHYSASVAGADAGFK